MPNSILPLTRNNSVNTRRSRAKSYEGVLLALVQISLIIIVITSLFIFNNSTGYNENKKNEVDPVLWISSFQSVYMFCILPFCTKHKKCFFTASIPYFTMLILSTNSFIEHNKVPFEKKFAIYHFTNLVANYLAILMICNIVVYYRIMDNPILADREDYVVQYNVMRSIETITKKEPINVVCSICMEHIDSVNENVVTNCNHTFHKKCLDKWISYRNDVCPNCRETIVIPK